ncbi:serine O-acetyltransferase EpsC [Streptomyces roseoverticillatus]|uniref:serine O-acetyltransferase EpsC n=1 Tax=Streptomyces roseoverticillatus TaxID=66429 RepID=UPI000694BDD9|nr:serine O-acetyltransferase EpsC [Streptomyces roseoverticillatus]
MRIVPRTGRPGPLRRLREDLEVVADRDPAVRSRAEALLSPFLPALWLHRPASRLHARGHRVTARVLSLAGRFLSGGVDIHPGARVGRRLFIDHAAAVVIGEDAVIGDDVTLYHQVTIGAVGWWRDRRRLPGERRHPTLGDRVVVGAGASVLGPVSVGDDSLIGAHALVTTDVPAGSRVCAPRSEIHPKGRPVLARAGGTEAKRKRSGL